jgi:hypothetical protein
MRKWLKIVVAVLVLLVAVFAGWLLTRPHEPEYQGRRLSDWLDDYNQASTWDIPETAAAIRAMGTNCLPFLFACIKRKPSPLKAKLVMLLSKQQLLKLPFYGVNRFRYPSIIALHALGPQAVPLCPDLVELAKNPYASWWATMSLLAIGTNAVPFLEAACQNTNQAGAEAVLMIAMMKSMPPPYFSWGRMKAPLNGKPTVILGYAVSSEDVGQVAKLLEHPSPAVRRASADALRRYTGSVYGEVLKSAMPLLIKTCGDTNEAVRISASTTLKMINPEAAANAGIK